MKKLMFAFATVLAFAATISLTSCGEDACAKVECGTHGKCNAGTCDCDAGYEKDTNGRCDLITSTKYTGSYTATEYDQVTGAALKVGLLNSKGKDSLDAAGKLYLSATYGVAVKTTTTSISKIIIEDLGSYRCINAAGKGVKAQVEATVKGDSLFIDYKECNNYWKGKGIKSGNTITISYTNTYPPDLTKLGSTVTDKNKTILKK